MPGNMNMNHHKPQQQCECECECVVYTKWHEKIICFLVHRILHHNTNENSNGSSSSSSSHHYVNFHLMLLSCSFVGIPLLGIILFSTLDDDGDNDNDNNNDLDRSNFPFPFLVAVPILLFAFTFACSIIGYTTTTTTTTDFVTMLTKFDPWETIHTVNDNFYETAGSSSKDTTNENDNGNGNGNDNTRKKNDDGGGDGDEGDGDNNNNNSTEFEYKATPIEELYYSQGRWRKASAPHHIVRFRGINLPAKTPLGDDGNDHGDGNGNGDGNHDHERNFYTRKADVSFIDKPFRIHDGEAKEHFQRLSNYGYNLIRLTVTWEAVMHEGPGIIDWEYVNYLSHLVDEAGAHGLYVMIDSHQDVWSRFTGGDGAPWWTLDAAGFITDDSSLYDAGCAFLDHLHKRDVHVVQHAHEQAQAQAQKQDNDGDRDNDKDDGGGGGGARISTKMKWGTNYGKLATATMFTLFFAGDEYAPGITVNEDDYRPRTGPGTDTQNEPTGTTSTTTTTTTTTNKTMSIQTFLQTYYVQFISVVAEAMKDKTNVIAFDAMNEPSSGYVGVNDLRGRTFPVPFGYMHSYFDGMRLGSGESLICEHYSSPFYFHQNKVLNAGGVLAWKSPNHDIWRKMGVYTVTSSGERILNRPDYFQIKGEEFDFTTKFMVPFFDKLQTILSRHNPRFILYAEPPIDLMNHQSMDPPRYLDDNADKYGWAPHWYDCTTLILLRYITWFAVDEVRQIPILFKSNIAAMMKRNLSYIKGNTKLHVVLGEVGVPFDMDFQGHNRMYAASTMALDRTMQAVEANDLDYTLWNYNADNTNEHGDHWNGEDLSIRTKTGNTNRALLAAVRPFVKCIPIQFDIISQSFDPSKHTKYYDLAIKWKEDEELNLGCGRDDDDHDHDDDDKSSLTIHIYIPRFHYFNPKTLISGCPKSFVRYDASTQTMIWGNIDKHACDSKVITLRVSN